MDTPIHSRAEARTLGLKQYYTGKPCPHGHTSPRYTASATCIDCHKEGNYRRLKLDQRKIMLGSARWRARARGIPCTIKLDDIVIPSHCPCCGVRLVPKIERLTRMKTGAYDTPSLDRKVPALGYVPGNVGVLCMKCNTRKSGIDEQMLKFLLDYLG